MKEQAKKKALWKLIAGIVAAACLALCLTACSGGAEENEPEEPVIEPLEVTGGISQNDFGVYVGYLVKNPNEGTAFENAYLSYVVKDADGKVLCSDNEYKLGTILPGEEFGGAMIGLTKNDAKAKTVEISIHSDEGVESDAVSGVTIDENSITTEYSNDFLSIDGAYTNETELPYDSLMFGAVAFDTDGNILAGGTDDQFNAKQGTAAFSISTAYPSSAAKPASIKYYAHVYEMNKN